MSVTAEIRAWVVQRFVDGLQEEHELLVMCDRIDARADELEEFRKRLEGAAKERADVTIFGVDYIALPKDADGETIHVGDMMETERFGVVEVEGFIHNAIAFNVYDPQPARICTVPANQCRRHHAPTVEDVLSEMLDAVDDDRYEQDRIIAEYAAKLRELATMLHKCARGMLCDLAPSCVDRSKEGCGMDCTDNGERCCMELLERRMRELGLEVD